jgi:hypothetical protein
LATSTFSTRLPPRKGVDTTDRGVADKRSPVAAWAGNQEP